MKRHTVATLVASGALMFSGLSLAAGSSSDQMGSGEESGAAMLEQSGSGQAQTPDLSGAYLSSNLVGTEVKNDQNETLGSIAALIVDQDGKVSHVVLEQEGRLGMGGNKYLVPWDRVAIDKEHRVATINVPKDQIAVEFSAFEEAQIGLPQQQSEPTLKQAPSGSEMEPLPESTQ